MLVCGALPFDSENLQQLKQKVVQCKYRVPFYLTTDCANLISNILVVNASKRFKLQQIKAHKWIKTNSSSTYFHMFNSQVQQQQQQQQQFGGGRRRFNRISNKFKSKSMKNLTAAAAATVHFPPSNSTAQTSTNNPTQENPSLSLQPPQTQRATTPSPTRTTTRRRREAAPAISQLSLPLYSFEQYYPLRVMVNNSNNSNDNDMNEITERESTDSPVNTPMIMTNEADANLSNLVDGLSLIASDSKSSNIMVRDFFFILFCANLFSLVKYVKHNVPYAAKKA